jgi:histone acetyltransferase (RNA polymerase elongator complex component)
MPKRQVTIPIFVPHQGCPHRCVFCDQRKATSVTRLPGPEHVDALVRQYAPLIKKSVDRVEIAFFGGSFTGMDPLIQEDFLHEAHRHLLAGSVHGIRISTRPDYISDEAIGLLEKYGVTTVELGVQSFDDNILAASGRGHTSAQARQAIMRLKEHGLCFVIQLMTGLPGDTPATSLYSAAEAAALAPSAVRIYPTVVLKGTGLETLYRAGQYAPLTLEEAVEVCRDMYLIFRSRSIPVIRMGVHPFAPGEAMNIVAGPYHPSFGYLVKSRARRDELAACVKRHIETGAVTADRVQVKIPLRFIEEYLGTNKDNIEYVRSAFNLARIDYTVEDIPAVLIA